MITLPGYLKLAVVLLITFMVIAFLYVASAFLIPLVFAILLSFLLLPVSRFLNRKGVHHGIAIVLSILLAFVVIGSIAFFFYTQIQSFADDGPMLKEKFNEKITDVQQYISQKFSISKREQKQFVDEQTESLKDSGGNYLSTFFSFTGTMLAAISLIPIYISIALVGLGNSNVFPIILSKAMLYMPEKKNEVSGLMIMGLFGGTIFPLLMGVMSDALASQIGALIVLSIGILYLVFLTFKLQKDQVNYAD